MSPDPKQTELFGDENRERHDAKKKDKRKEINDQKIGKGQSEKQRNSVGHAKSDITE